MVCKLSNYSNSYALVPRPLSANRPETVPIAVVDTNDWQIDPCSGGLVCRNSGTWTLSANYQIVNINEQTSASQAEINGYFLVNGCKILATCAADSVALKNGKGVLPVGLVARFERGDLLEFGIASYTDDDSLNVQIQQFFTDPARLPQAPSLRITASKVPCGPSGRNDFPLYM